MRSSVHVARALLGLILLGAAAPARAADLYADSTYGDDANDGLTWATARASVESAVETARLTPGPDTIRIAAGLYTKSLVLGSDTTLEGGYPPGGGKRDISLHLTMLAGGGAFGSTITIQSAANVSIDGLDIRGGTGTRMSGSLKFFVGGGLFVDQSTGVRLHDLTVRYNKVTGSCEAYFTTCSPSLRSDAPSGAGIYASASDLEIDNCLFTANEARWDFWEDSTCTGVCGGLPTNQIEGAVINIGGGSVRLHNLTVTRNLCSVRFNTCASNVLIRAPGAVVADSIFFSNFLAIEDYATSGNDPSNCLIEKGDLAGGGNIAGDPLFVGGRNGTDFHLSQIASGQPSDSPCLDAGGRSALDAGLDAYTTRSDLDPDVGVVDMGYHYPVPPPIPPVLLMRSAPRPTVTYNGAPGRAYDVIRTLRSALRDTGSSIDLGAVDCLADDDLSRAVEDPLAPAATGDVILYFIGEDSASPKYGSTDAKPRVPGAGDCP